MPLFKAKRSPRGEGHATTERLRRAQRLRRHYVGGDPHTPRRHRSLRSLAVLQSVPSSLADRLFEKHSEMKPLNGALP